MKYFSFYASALLALTASATSVVAQTAVTKYVSSVSTGIVGLSVTQSAQLNIVNLSPVPVGASPVVACTAELDFYDGQGRLLTSSTVKVAPDSAASLTLKYTSIPAVSVAARTPIRGVVRTGPLVPGATSTAVPAGCELATTLELFDNATGATQAVISETYPAQ